MSYCGKGEALSEKKSLAMKNIKWLQITAGIGPKECGWIATKLCNKILMYAQEKNIQADVIEYLAFEKNITMLQGSLPSACRSIVIRLEAENLERVIHEWAGTIQWKGKSPFRPKHKRTNWFVGVEAIEEMVKPTVSKGTLQRETLVETMKSSGPGGQHVNKKDSAVRITHMPTGLKVRVDTDRSQHRNREIALARLQMILNNNHSDEQSKVQQGRWLNHYQVERGNAKKVFTGLDFKELKGNRR